MTPKSYLLKESKILFFVDRSKEKQGYVINGLECIEYEKFLRFDKDIPVIVCVPHPESVVRDLFKQGFLNVYSYEEILTKHKQWFDTGDDLGIREIKQLLERGLNGDDKPTCMVNEMIAGIISDYRIREHECSRD